MKIGEFITGVAVAAFMLSLCTIDGNMILSIITMFVSGAWIVSYSWWQEEERRLREGR